MKDIELLNKIATLPSTLKVEVADFVDFLINKYPDACEKKQPLKFGMMKGAFVMRDDFDEPLDLLDARLVEDRKLEKTIPFDEFVSQLKEEAILDDLDSLNIKILINNTREVYLTSPGLYLIRCNNLSTFAVLQYPENLNSSTVFYSFPAPLTNFLHVKAQEIFDIKVKSGKNIGQVIIDSIKEKIDIGFSFFFINPAGVDGKGIEMILDYMSELNQNPDNSLSFVFVVDHVSYHYYFEDESFSFGPLGKKREAFSIKPLW